jgi:hypothetical protein
MRRVQLAMAVTLLGVWAMAASGQVMQQQGPVAGAGGTVTLPYLVSENGGNQWRIFQGGWLQQQGNQPLYSQGAMLLINGNQISQNNNEGRIDAKTGELVIDGLGANGLTISRRIWFNQNEGWLRYIDIFKNTQSQELTVNLMIQTNLNYGVNTAQTVADPKKADQNLAWVAQTGAGASVVEIFGGHKAKNVPTITWPQGNNYVQASMSLTLAPGKQAALMHMHAITATQDAGVAFVNGLKDVAIMRSIPPEFRRLIVNFVGGENFVGDVEILRGDLLDVVELRTGDQFKGTLKEPAYDLQTTYGPISVPVDQVVGLINVGRYRPRQLVITSDGQIIGGQLKKTTIDLQLSSGQVTSIPLSQITRIGYRRQSTEPVEWNFEGKALVMTRDGERVAIQLPTTPVEVLTRYGRLELKPEQIGGIILQNEDSGVHEIQLTDGSRFAGLMEADELSAQLSIQKGQSAHFPIGQISRVQFAGKIAESDDFTPMFHLANEDLLVGTLSGTLKLDTTFDTISVNGAEVKSMDRLAEGSRDVQVVMWDGATLSGQVESSSLDCRLKCGVDMSIPVPLFEHYVQPQPTPSAEMMDRIRAAIKDLSDPDWKRRDRAASVLTRMGPVVEGPLNEMRINQPEEAQRSIDNILSELEKQRQQKPAAATPAPSPVPNPN